MIIFFIVNWNIWKKERRCRYTSFGVLLFKFIFFILSFSIVFFESGFIWFSPQSCKYCSDFLISVEMCPSLVLRLESLNQFSWCGDSLVQMKWMLSFMLCVLSGIEMYTWCILCRILLLSFDLQSLLNTACSVLQWREVKATWSWSGVFVVLHQPGFPSNCNVESVL
jgi:hypothetical protein